MVNRNLTEELEKKQSKWIKEKYGEIVPVESGKIQETRTEHSVRGRRCGLLICLLNVFPSRVLFQAIANTSVFCKGICSRCRGKISNIGEKLLSIEESATKCIREKRTGTRTIVYTTVDDSPVHQNHSAYVEPDTPGYQPQLPLPARSNKTSNKKTLEELNNLLRERDFSPVRYCLRDPWSSVLDRTKREHFRKINQSVQAVIGTIAPGQEDNVWYDFVKAQVEKCTREIRDAPYRK